MGMKVEFTPQATPKTIVQPKPGVNGAPQGPERDAQIIQDAKGRVEAPVNVNEPDTGSKKYVIDKKAAFAAAASKSTDDNGSVEGDQ